jgi:hypothetical protein
VQNTQNLHRPIIGKSVEEEMAGGSAFLTDVEYPGFWRQILASVTEQGILRQVYACFLHQCAVFAKLVATKTFGGETQCVADIGLRHRSENHPRHLSLSLGAQRFGNCLVHECFELGVQFELRAIAVEGRDAFIPGALQAGAIVWQRARKLVHELEALIGREVGGFSQ